MSRESLRYAVEDYIEGIRPLFPLGWFVLAGLVAGLAGVALNFWCGGVL